MQYWTTEMEKQVGERLQILLTDPLLLKAYERFGGRLFRRSSVFHGLGKFLDERGVSGDVCFEVGTWNGLTAAILSRHFKEVVSVDIAHNQIKHDVLAYLGIKNVRCIDILDNEDKARVAEDTIFDFAYLDGNHAEDTEADFELVKACKHVLFHEAWPHQPPVWDLIHRLPHQEIFWGGAGLAIWDGR